MEPAVTKGVVLASAGRYVDVWQEKDRLARPYERSASDTLGSWKTAGISMEQSLSGLTWLRPGVTEWQLSWGPLVVISSRASESWARAVIKSIDRERDGEDARRGLKEVQLLKLPVEITNSEGEWYLFLIPALWVDRFKEMSAEVCVSSRRRRTNIRQTNTAVYSKNCIVGTILGYRSCNRYNYMTISLQEEIYLVAIGMARCPSGPGHGAVVDFLTQAY